MFHFPNDKSHIIHAQNMLIGKIIAKEQASGLTANPHIVQKVTEKRHASIVEWLKYKKKQSRQKHQKKNKHHEDLSGRVIDTFI